jgi:RHS repeat-associated protein
VVGVGFATNGVSVNGQAAYRKGEYFWKEVATDNSGAAQWLNISATATNQTTVSGNAWVPKTPENFGYDADGNLTSDGRWNYSWDAENRLVKLVANTGVGPQQQIRFEYDPKGRRIAKKVWPNTAGTGSLTTDLKFIYDGWNLVAELNATNNAVVRSYLWGLDLSGSMQGAGGIGGLLRVTCVGAQTTNAFVAFDGNGNVASLVNAADGATVAQYEYGPFGEVIRATGPVAKVNPFRFSTKYQDEESDLLYYGYRYHSPSTGRWISRDPIEEQGGKNLYGNVGNNPLFSLDALGMEAQSYSYQESTPHGMWAVSLAEVTSGGDAWMGFRSSYMPFIITPVGTITCPCELKNLVLVQAITGRTWLPGSAQPTHFDVYTDRNHPYPYHDSNTPIPPYTTYPDLTIEDAPHVTQSPNTSGTWTIEDCAVCRVKKGASVSDTVYGCVKFTFHIDDSGVRTLSVAANGATQSGKSGYLAISEKPGKVWKDALKRWRTPGRSM